MKKCLNSRRFDSRTNDSLPVDRRSDKPSCYSLKPFGSEDRSLSIHSRCCMPIAWQIGQLDLLSAFESRFVLEIVEIHSASHLFRKSTRKEEDSLTVDLSQFAVIELDLSCCQFEQSVHQQPL